MKRLILTALLSVVIFVASAVTPKYIFLIIGDGMGMGHVMATESYNRNVLKSTEPLLMMQFPVNSVAMTFSANKKVTDSAAAGTALATGVKTNNYTIGMDAEGNPVTSVATELKTKYGYGVAMVTSVAYDDATPATHYAHRSDRGMFEGINYDGARSEFDFIAGAGSHQDEKDKEITKRLFKDYEAHGYSVVRGVKNLKDAKTDKILLISDQPYKPNQIGYTIDSIPGATTLAQYTQASLDHLMRVSPKGFFMMIEGGNIDHAAHSNDGGTVVKEILNFQQSVQLAYDFYKAHPEETLIVITADHDTGGMAMGVAGGSKEQQLQYIDYQKISKERFNDFCVEHRDFTWEQMKQALTDKLGFFTKIEITEKEEEALKAEYAKMQAKKDQTLKTLYKDYKPFAAKVFDIQNHKIGFGFTTFFHTGGFVPVYAVGVGCDRFKGLNNNIDIPNVMRELTGLK